MSGFNPEPVLAELVDFQQRTVHHVMDQLHDPAGSGRFLVADETGLGKSMVARGVIAKTIQKLEQDDSVQRIDIVYVCSNTDLAEQNLKRLNVTSDSDQVTPLVSRLTLLGMETGKLNRRSSSGKPVNLVSFTPGTSFEMGNRTGKAEERALLYVILAERFDLDGHQNRAALRLLQGGVRDLARFERMTWDLTESLLPGGFDSRIKRHFHRLIGRGGRKSLEHRFAALVHEMGRKRSVPDAFREEQVDVIRGMRSDLARASVEALEPDLVILDEFQRFRHLLSTDNSAGELAHELFNYSAAKVLLLSATRTSRSPTPRRLRRLRMTMLRTSFGPYVSSRGMTPARRSPR